MPFHHVTAGLLYKGNYLNRSLSAGSDSEQLANISVEELDGSQLDAGVLRRIFQMSPKDASVLVSAFCSQPRSHCFLVSLVESQLAHAALCRLPLIA
ncbi:Calcium-binding protein 8 [Camelus dromedarius]|uniref:Calcium-binding protein 8 n=1 Tax=Camelus dromedarius TaxID=9838 RepID=A0A5N4CWN4_CAMDR|nr:Calcium-binding protein 8 [Camelus dromedarius]